ncbi:hypothetical protein MFLAVUS_007937 [Mucor flavus]|uniref:Uncharacterized protein n=1 Tax=Mucor flavus TaxID=439312 RepID=A0ABP9Z5U9_9FUNG
MVYHHYIARNVTTNVVHRKQTPKIMQRVLSSLSTGHKNVMGNRTSGRAESFHLRAGRYRKLEIERIEINSISFDEEKESDFVSKGDNRTWWDRIRFKLSHPFEDLRYSYKDTRKRIKELVDTKDAYSPLFEGK